MKFLIVCAFVLAYTVPLVLGGGRIFKGKNAAKGQFPYQARIAPAVNKTEYSCGASLIAKNWLLTAAHCIYGRDVATIFLGSTHRTDCATTVTASKKNNDFIIHHRYNHKTMENDIALVKIPAVTLGKCIDAVELPVIGTAYSNYAGENAIVAGWGRKGDAPTTTNDLQYTTTKVLSNTDCQIAYPEIFLNGMLCAKGDEKSSTCVGDSGGPLVVTKKNTQIGIVSWLSLEGCEKGFPMVFTRITEYAQWIKEKSNVFTKQRNNS